MNHATKCKICGKNMVVQIDEDYSKMGDPFKLIAMATCNRCYDLRDRRLALEKAITANCLELFHCSKISQEKIDKIRENLTTLTKKYSQWLGEFLHLTGALWDVEFVNLLMEKPQEHLRVLAEYRRHFADEAKTA